MPWLADQGILLLQDALEHVPQVLVVNVVMVLDFRRLYERAQQSRTTVSRRLFQVGIAALHIVAKELGGPIGFPEVFNRRIDVVRQIAFGLAQVLDLGRIALQCRF